MSKPERLSIRFLVAAGSFVLAAPGVAHQTDTFHFHIDPIVFEVLEVDVDTESSKFNEYRDIRSGFNLPRLRLFGESPNGGDRTLAIRADQVRRDDARYTLEYWVAGSWGLTLDYNKIPHRFGNDGVFLWTRTGPGLLELPDPTQGFLQSAITAQRAASPAGVNFAFLNNLLAPFIATADRIDLGLQRDRTRGHLDVAKMHPWGLAFDVQHENRSGIRPYAGSFGFGNSIEIFEPTDYQTTHAVASAEMTRERAGLRFGYRHSTFENDVSTLFWDNPFRLTDATDASAYLAPGAASIAGASRGFSDLAPDNDSGLFFLEGRTEVAGGWRLSGDVGYNVMEQDEPLLPYTLNTAIVGIDHVTGATFNPTLVSSLPAASADTEVTVLNFDVNASRRFGEDWTLKLLYRYYDYDNNSPQIPFDGYVRFHGVWESIPRISVPFAFTRDDLGAELDWELSDRTNLGLSYHLKGTEREFREVDDSEENVLKLSYDTRPTDMLTLRASWERGDRTIDEYLVEAQEYSFLDPEGPNNLPGLRKFDEAAREFDDFEASAYLLLSEAWNLNVGISGRNEDYDESQFGLIFDDVLQYSVDLAYAPGEDWSLYVFGHLADRETFQHGRQSGATPSTDPLADWTVEFDESTDTVGVGVNGSLSDRWQWDIGGDWSRSDGDADFFSPPGGTPDVAVDFDNYEDIELTAVVLRLDYVINSRAEVGVLYRFEDYTIDSFNLEGLLPYLPSTLLLVANDGDYQADVFGIHLSFDM